MLQERALYRAQSLGFVRRVKNKLMQRPAELTITNLDKEPRWMEVRGSEPLVVNTSYTLPTASGTGGGGGGTTGQVTAISVCQQGLTLKLFTTCSSCFCNTCLFSAAVSDKFRAMG